MKHRLSFSGVLSPRGFGLLELVIAAGIVGLIASAVASLTLSQMKGSNTSRFRTQSDVLVNEVRAVLSAEEACALTFMPVALTGATNLAVANVKDKDGSNKFIIGNRYENFAIQSATLRDYVHVGGTTGNARFELNLLANDNSVYGPGQLSRSINIRTQRDAANNMIGCIATSEMSDGIWQRDPSTISDIFYVGGSVLVGTESPGMVADGLGPRLSIGGNTNLNSDRIFIQRDAWANNNTVLRISVGDDANQTAVSSDSLQMGATDFSTGNWVPMVHLETGSKNLGVGTTTPQARLDVAGEIKVSSTGTACAAANEGTLRYNFTTKIMEYCGGSPLAWRTLVPSIVAGCDCRPIYSGGTSCGDAASNTWTCWGGANVTNPPVMVCPAGSNLRITGNGEGGPTGFICISD